MKYRIAERKTTDGKTRFIPQKRILWIWWDCTMLADGNATCTVAFDTKEEAERHINTVERGSHVVSETIHEL